MNPSSRLRGGFALLALGFTALMGAAAAPVWSSPRAPLAITLSVGETAPGRPVPAGFVGLSYEMADLPLVASLAGRGDLVSLLSSLGPAVMRFGGNSGDGQVAWLDPATLPLPGWATTALVPADLYRLARLTRATGWHVVLSVNLAHFDPVSAADEARVAKRALGRSLNAIEIGNEPTAFVSEHLREGAYTFSAYRQQVEEYRAAIAAAAPGLAIVGPDNEPPASNPSNLEWARSEAATVRPKLLTGHLYGASKCSRVPPTAALLLTPAVHRSEQRALRVLERVGRTYRIPVWLDETNNISCHGQPGVSDTFATALWAVDLLTRTLSPPFAGDAFHGFLQEPDGYSPLAALSPAALARGAISARAEWYALLLARQVEGDRPLRLGTVARGLNIAVWAGRSRDGRLQVIVDDEQPAGSRALLIRVKSGVAARSASILRLTGPSITSTTGVTLGGAAVSSRGTWRPSATLPRIASAHGILSVRVGPASAVLMTTER